jgi:hypothetical protein
MTGHNPKSEVLAGPQRRRRWAAGDLMVTAVEHRFGPVNRKRSSFPTLLGSR